MYNNISFYFSSDCNMNCDYCTINKHKSDMVQYNKKIRESIITGEYARNVIHKFEPLKEKMCEFGLWGMEPTINADVAKYFLPPLFDYFTNINKIMFSTNSWLGYERIKPFIDLLSEYNTKHNRNIELDLQISIDGPLWVNDDSRRKGTTERTVQAVKDVVTKTSSDTNCRIFMHVKPTLQTKYMKIMNSSPSKLLEYFVFFDDLQKEVSCLCKNKNITLCLAGAPTLVNPGYHTVEDGKILAEFIKNVRQLDDSKFRYLRHPLIMQTMRGFTEGFEVQDRHSYINWGCCSAGKYTANVNDDAEIFSCHSFFGYKYLNSKSILATSHTTTQNKDIKRLQYIDLLWHDYPESKRHFIGIIIRSLASVGQIDTCYLTSPKMQKLLYYAAGGLYCQYGQMETTYSMWAYPTSLFKLLGNGAVQETLRYMKQCGLLK